MFINNEIMKVCKFFESPNLKTNVDMQEMYFIYRIKKTVIFKILENIFVNKF